MYEAMERKLLGSPWSQHTLSLPSPPCLFSPLPVSPLSSLSTQDEAYDYCLKNGTYPLPEYHMPFSPWLLWKLRLFMLFWFIVLVFLPCVLILPYLSWTYLLFLLLISLLCESCDSGVFLFANLCKKHF